MSKNPESVPFVRRVLQISQTGERWFLLAGHATVVDRCAYSSPLTWVRQVLSSDGEFVFDPILQAFHAFQPADCEKITATIGSVF
jgi:hypothetical protein